MGDLQYDTRVDWKSLFQTTLAGWTNSGPFSFHILDDTREISHISIFNDFLVVCGTETMRFFDVYDLECRHEVPCGGAEFVLAVGRDRMLVQSGTGVFLYTWADMELLHTWGPSAVPIVVHGELAVMSRGDARLLVDLRTYETIERKPVSKSGEDGVCAISEDGRRLAVSVRESHNGIIGLYDIDHTEGRYTVTLRRVVSDLLPNDSVLRLAYCGEYLLLGSDTGNLLSVDENGSLISSICTTFFNNVREGLLVRDNEVFTANFGSRARMSRLSESGEIMKVAHYKRHGSWVHDIAVASDLLFTTSSDGLRIWRIPPADTARAAKDESLEFQFHTMDGGDEQEVCVHEGSGLVFLLERSFQLENQRVIVGCQQTRKLDLPVYSREK